MAFEDYAWIIGALVSMVGSIFSNFGVNIQKYSFMKDSDKPEEEKKQYYKNPLWVLGLSLVIFGSLGDFAALGLAAQSIVAPIGATTLIANIFFAHFWLMEDLTKRDLIGTVLIVAGSVLAVVFGDHSKKEYTVADLVSYYKKTGFIVYAVVLSVVTLGLYITVKFIEPIKLRLLSAVIAYDEAEKSRKKKAILRADAILSILEEEYKKYEKIHPFIYCTISGIFGGQNILFGKMVAELINASIGGDNQMFNPLTYLFLLCMLVSIFTQLHFLAKALNWFDALYVVPVFQCFFITISTIAGAAYFGEFNHFTPTQWVAFPLGIGMTLLGVYVLSSREMTREVIRNKSGDFDNLDEIEDIEIRGSMTKQNRVDSFNKIPRRSIYAKSHTPHKLSINQLHTNGGGQNNSKKLWKTRGSIVMDNFAMLDTPNPVSTFVDHLMPDVNMPLMPHLQDMIHTIEEGTDSGNTSRGSSTDLKLNVSDSSLLREVELSPFDDSKELFSSSQNILSEEDVQLKSDDTVPMTEDIEEEFVTNNRRSSMPESDEEGGK